MILSTRVYDALKWITLVLLPAIGVFYFSMADTWNLPYATEIVATISGLDLFLAALLGISTNKFNITNPMYRLNLVKLVGNSDIRDWVFSTSTYEILTWTAQVFLPAFISLYGGLATVWHLPYPEQIVSTLIALDALLGVLLGFSTAQFHKAVAVELIENKDVVLVDRNPAI